MIEAKWLVFPGSAMDRLMPFYTKTEFMTDLGALGGIDSRAISINNRGDIIGYYTLADNSVHAFLYTDGEMIGL
jgi:probable HAF family extracellular repeat protein